MTTRQKALEENRAARITIGADTFRRLLRLPEGFTVERLWVDYDPMTIGIVVSAPTLEPQPLNCSLPALAGNWSTQLYWDEKTGAMFVHWAWFPEPTEQEVDLAQVQHTVRLQRQRIQELEMTIRRLET